MEFSRQEYWIRLPFPSPGDLLNPGTESRFPALQILYHPSHKGNPHQLCAKLLRSSPTVCNTMDYSPPGSSVHGILQSRMLVWLPFLGDLPNPGVKPTSPALAGKFLTTEKPGKPLNHTQIQNKKKKNFKIYTSFYPWDKIKFKPQFPPHKKKWSIFP